MTQKRILVVDGGPFNRGMTADLLSHAGYSVETAASIGAGLEAVVQCEPDVVLLDLDMIDGDVRSVVGQFWRVPCGKAFDIIPMVSDPGGNEAREALTAGCRGCIGKRCPDILAPWRFRDPAAFIRALEEIAGRGSDERMSQRFSDSDARSHRAFATALRSFVGHPTGSMVVLSNGAVARVRQEGASDPSQPLVEMILDHGGNRLDEPIEFDLAKEPSLTISYLCCA
jgi:CheY-like chemotaxis protein